MKPRAISDLVVPRKGQSIWLIVLSAAAMCFMAVFVLALAVSSAQLARNWNAALAQTATVRISAPPDEMDAQTAIVLEVLRTTPGIAEARIMTTEDQTALLSAWLGPDLPLDALPMPRLIELTETSDGPDRQGLRLRLTAEAPGAVFDDHTRWRRPLVQAAGRMQMLAIFSLGLMGAVMVVIITLAASTALAANAQVIRVLRLVGARDRFIARAFVRRISRRALIGALAGTGLGLVALATVPDAASSSVVFAGMGFRGVSWLLPLALVPVVTLLAWAASFATAFRVLRGVT